MTGPPASAATHGALEILPQLSPAFLGLALVTVVVFAGVYAYRPPIPQTAVFAFVPWVVAGALLSVLATDHGYPEYLHPFITEPEVYLLAVLVPGLAWLGMLYLSVSRRALPAYHHYVGAMGIGVAAIVSSVLLVQHGAGILSRLAVLLVVPNVALFATGLISLSIWFWSPDFVDYVPVVGAFALFGALVNGIATTLTVAVVGPGAHTPFSAAIRDVVAQAAPGGLAGFDATLLWVWLFLIVNVAVGVHVAVNLAHYADESPGAVNAMLGIAGMAGFALGFDRLLLVVVG